MAGIAVGPAELEQAAGIVGTANNEVQTANSQLNAAKASLESAINAAMQATQTALSGGALGATMTMFDEKQALLRSEMNVYDGNIAQTIATAQRLSQILSEFQTALTSAASKFSTTDAEIAASFAPII